MATPGWIDSAARTPRRPVAADRLTDAHVLAMPAAERDYVLKERERAHRLVERLGGEHADELLEALGLIEEAA